MLIIRVLRIAMVRLLVVHAALAAKRSSKVLLLLIWSILAHVCIVVATLVVRMTLVIAIGTVLALGVRLLMMLRLLGLRLRSRLLLLGAQSCWIWGGVSTLLLSVFTISRLSLCSALVRIWARNNIGKGEFWKMLSRRRPCPWRR
jgi:hypothetical protein